MSFHGPIQWHYFEADLIWPDSTFKDTVQPEKRELKTGINRTACLRTQSPMFLGKFKWPSLSHSKLNWKGAGANYTTKGILIHDFSHDPFKISLNMRVIFPNFFYQCIGYTLNRFFAFLINLFI
jgi:hypothetical protein